jgi:ribosomal protein RSM22 (predicted rRNA methylase)
MNRFPGNLDKAVADWLQGRNQNMAAKSAAMTEAYRQGDASSAVDVHAYVAVRLPATFAACLRVLTELAEVDPELQPQSVLDVGAGPGTASWAALTQWPGISTMTMVEREAGFADLAARLSAASGIAALQAVNIVQQPLQQLDSALTAELVLASYVLAEVPLSHVAPIVEGLWQRAKSCLVLIEPGTPQGFARLRSARDALMRTGAFIAAPCTHQQSCPMAGGDWCHFKVRLQRSRTHMHAKQAAVPFEDEAFSYLIASRSAAPSSGARIVAPVKITKVAAGLQLCDKTGLRRETIASRDRPAYKRANKVRWGDTWE